MVNSRDIGAKAERDIANYFKSRGGPACHNARRLVATGWRNGSTDSPDQGDIAGVPGLCIQSKALAKPLAGKLLADTWSATQQQAAARTAETRSRHQPIIIERRRGCADVGRWIAHLDARFYTELVTGRAQLVLHNHLLRVDLGDLMPDLRVWIGQHAASPLHTH